MAQASEAFTAHVVRVREYTAHQLSEADTRAYLVDPLLRILGYEGVNDLRREVPVQATKESLDYLLLADGRPYAIVEAKALRHGLTDQDAAQCVQYASIIGVRWCLITNGVTWVLYDAHAKGPLQDKRLVEVRIGGDELATEQAWAVLSLFSREQVAKSNPIAILLIERVVTDELTRPDSPAIAALRRAVRSRFGEQVSGRAIVDAIANRMRKATSGASENVATDSVAAHLPPTSSTQKTPQNPVATAGTGARVTLADLVAAGLLPAEAPLQARVHGVSHVARLRDGQIDLNGVLYSTPSAASIALRSVKLWNGWTDWQYRGETLAILRDRLLAAKGSLPGRR